MSENQNRGLRDFSKYDTMETEELEQILRLDAEAPEGTESDIEILLYIMGVLAGRKNNKHITRNTAAKAWESFQTNYMPSECIEHTPRKAHRFTKPWVRRLISAAAMIALLIFIPFSARALSLEKLWDIFARWAKETFSFVSEEYSEIREPDTENGEEYISLQDALEKNNINTDIVPIWIPDGFVLEKIEKIVSPIQEIYRAYYRDGDKELKIRVQTYIEGDPGKVEIDKDLIEIHKVNNIEYYIVSNHAQVQAIWTIDSYECYIAGDISIEELKNMIDSIEKG